jgi:hypothetical protein
VLIVDLLYDAYHGPNGNISDVGTGISVNSLLPSTRTGSYALGLGK